jgi:DNA-directed RNA polymerase subunit M/transcription elongation factor TFIIS
MKFCDCQNIMLPVVTPSGAYHECMVCKKQVPFGPGDTLIRPAAIRPTPAQRNAHIIRYLSDKNVLATCDDRPCPKCGHQFAKVLIDEQTWYGCMGCGHAYA